MFILTWNTVRQDCGKVSKWDRDSTASVNFPPKICIPNREKMKMNRKRITSKELMEEMEFTRDFTRLPMEAQYLLRKKVLEEILTLKLGIRYSHPGWLQGSLLEGKLAYLLRKHRCCKCKYCPTL